MSSSTAWYHPKKNKIGWLTHIGSDPYMGICFALHLSEEKCWRVSSHSLEGLQVGMLALGYVCIGEV